MKYLLFFLLCGSVIADDRYNQIVKRNAFALLSSACDVLPSATSNFFSANSCCPNKSIDSLIDGLFNITP